MKIGSVGGIGVYIHWTFWLLVMAYMLSAVANSGIAAGLYGMAFILSIFACVVAHEFGHAWSASWYGIRTQDITLLPIGGVARLQRMPEKPVQEIVIALAGPAVNVIIAALLFVLILYGVLIGQAAPALGVELDFVEQLFWANVVLVLFNLLPAFPMDGGRVLRGVLGMWTSHIRATEIAARVGRWMALLFAITAIFVGPLTLLLVAGFIFLAGTAELMSARVREVARTEAQRQRGQTGWATHLWPHEGTTYSSERGPNDDIIIDAVEVRQIK